MLTSSHDQICEIIYQVEIHSLLFEANLHDSILVVILTPSAKSPKYAPAWTH